MTYEYEQYLAHYGVKGQKWGQRQYQNEDGSYTEAGKERYWGSSGNRQPSTQQPSYAKPVRAVRPVQRQIENRETPEQAVARKEARKQKTKKILAVAGAVTLAAVAAYGVRKGATKLRDKARADIWQRDYFDSINNNKNRKHYNDKIYSEYVQNVADYAQGKANSVNRMNAGAYWLKRMRNRWRSL